MFQSLKEVEKFFNERKKIGIKPGLERVKLLLEKVGHPEKKLHAIHVAGTNGKGSTIQFLKNALISNQYEVGVFTSPSFTGLNGHFLINDKEINERDLLSLINHLLPFIHMLDNMQMHPTEFEIITAMAFLYFKDRVDIAIIETGMGGRYDTTNCFTPILAIITNVEKDHMRFLGNTIEEITFHKTGIIKENRPIIVGPLRVESERIIKKEVKEHDAPLYQLQKDFSFRVEDKQIITWEHDKQLTVKFTLQMQGFHQIENASVAIMALFLLNKDGFTIDWACVTESVHHTSLPGRFETVHEHPTIILDSAHNVAGIKAFLQTVNNKYKQKNKHLLFAGFKDKQLTQMLQELEGKFTTMTVTTFDHERAATVKELRHCCSDMNLNVNWEDAIIEILDNKYNQNDVYFITGSLHFITLVRQFLK